MQKILLSDMRKIFNARINNWQHRANMLGQFSDVIIDDDLFFLLEYFNYKCVYCGTELTRENLEFDHAIPLNKYFAEEYYMLNTVSNIVCSCLSCNRQKQDMTYFEFADTTTVDKIEQYFTQINPIFP